MIIYIFWKNTGQLTKNIFHVIAAKKKICIFGIFAAISQRGEVDRKEFTERVKQIYEQIVYWKKNLLLLSSERASRSFSEDTVRLLNNQIEGAALKNTSIKAAMIMPSLLWQKLSKKSRLKDHLVALKRRRSCRKGYYMKERRVKNA